MKRGGMGLTLCLTSLVVVGCAAEQEAGPVADIEIPRPDLQQVETDVRSAVEADYDEVVAHRRSAEAWGKLGDRYRIHQWSLAAADCYAQAERLDPEEFRWPYLQGRALLAIDPLRAATALRRALAIDDSYAPAQIYLGYTSMRLGEVDGARAAFARAAELDPRNANAQIGLGQIALSEMRFEEARATLSRALLIDPAHREGHRSLAQVYHALGKSEMAERHAQLAQRYDTQTRMDDPRGAPRVAPAGSIGYLEAGLALLAAGRRVEAARAFEAVLHVDSRHSLAHHQLGQLLSDEGKHAAAEEHFRAILALRPDEAVACRLVGRELALQARLDEAARQVEDCLDRHPRDADSWHLLGRIADDRGDDARAEACLSKAVALAPEDADIRYSIGTFFATRGRFDEAIEQLSIAVQSRPDDADMRTNLGLALLKQGRTIEARAELEQALKLQPRHPQAAAALARLK